MGNQFRNQDIKNGPSLSHPQRFAGGGNGCDKADPREVPSAFRGGHTPLFLYVITSSVAAPYMQYPATMRSLPVRRMSSTTGGPCDVYRGVMDRTEPRDSRTNQQLWTNNTYIKIVQWIERLIGITLNICRERERDIYLSVCLSIYLSIYLSINLSIYLCACLPVCLSVYQSIDVSIHES